MVQHLVEQKARSKVVPKEILTAHHWADQKGQQMADLTAHKTAHLKDIQWADQKVGTWVYMKDSQRAR